MQAQRCGGPVDRRAVELEEVVDLLVGAVDDVLRVVRDPEAGHVSADDRRIVQPGHARSAVDRGAPQLIDVGIADVRSKHDVRIVGADPEALDVPREERVVEARRTHAAVDGNRVDLEAQHRVTVREEHDRLGVRADLEIDHPAADAGVPDLHRGRATVDRDREELKGARVRRVRREDDARRVRRDVEQLGSDVVGLERARGAERHLRAARERPREELARSVGLQVAVVHDAGRVRRDREVDHVAACHGGLVDARDRSAGDRHVIELLLSHGRPLRTEDDPPGVRANAEPRAGRDVVGRSPVGRDGPFQGARQEGLGTTVDRHGVERPFEGSEGPRRLEEHDVLRVGADREGIHLHRGQEDRRASVQRSGEELARDDQLGRLVDRVLAVRRDRPVEDPAAVHEWDLVADRADRKRVVREKHGGSRRRERQGESEESGLHGEVQRAFGPGRPRTPQAVARGAGSGREGRLATLMLQRIPNSRQVGAPRSPVDPSAWRRRSCEPASRRPRGRAPGGPFRANRPRFLPPWPERTSPRARGTPRPGPRPSSRRRRGCPAARPRSRACARPSTRACGR